MMHDQLSRATHPACRTAGTTPSAVAAQTRSDHGAIMAADAARQSADDVAASAQIPPRRQALPVTRVLTADGSVVCERCERAESSLARLRGLLGRDSLAPGEGMLINPGPSVHMFFMRFPIDVVFLDRSKKVVKVVHDLQPWRTAGARRAVAALELPAGTAARCGLREGETLTLEELAGEVAT
jgi:uncharacterized protein